jgi:hypothetical protein
MLASAVRLRIGVTWFGRQSSGRVDGSGDVGAKKMELAVEKDGRRFSCERHGDRV